MVRGGAVRTEAVGLRLASPTGGARLAGATDFGLQSEAVVLIVDDDVAEVESAGMDSECLLFGAETATIQLTRTESASAGEATVRVTVASPGSDVEGAALEGSDFNAGAADSSVEVVFAPGNTTATAVIQLRYFQEGEEAPMPEGNSTFERRYASLVVHYEDIDGVTGLDVLSGAVVAADGESSLLGSICFGSRDEVSAVVPGDRDEGEGGASGGLIAGVVVGALVVVAIGVGVAYFMGFGRNDAHVSREKGYRVTQAPAVASHNGKKPLSPRSKQFAFANPMGEKAAVQARKLVGTPGSSEEDPVPAGASLGAEEGRKAFTPKSTRRPSRGGQASGFV